MAWSWYATKPTHVLICNAILYYCHICAPDCESYHIFWVERMVSKSAFKTNPYRGTGHTHSNKHQPETALFGRRDVFNHSHDWKLADALTCPQGGKVPNAYRSAKHKRRPSSESLSASIFRCPCRRRWQSAERIKSLSSVVPDSGSTLVIIPLTIKCLCCVPCAMVFN